MMDRLGLTWPSLRTLAGVGLAVLLLAGLAASAWLWSNAQQERARQAYAGVLTRLASSQASGTAPEVRAAAVRDLETTLTQYPGAAPAAHAAYELGNARYAERDYGRARAAYDIAAARAEAAPTLRTMARVAIGYTWENEGDFSKAIAAHQAALLDLKSGDFYYEDLLINLARAQERAGRKEDAVQTYRRVLKDVPSGLRADDVRSRLASLGAAP